MVVFEPGWLNLQITGGFAFGAQGPMIMLLCGSYLPAFACLQAARGSR